MRAFFWHVGIVCGGGWPDTAFQLTLAMPPPAPISKLVFEVAAADGGLANRIRPLVKNAHAVLECSSKIEIGGAEGRGAAKTLFIV